MNSFRKMRYQKFQQRGQAALEYMLLLTVVAVVVLLALKPTGTNSILNRAKTDTEGHYNTVTEVIMGKNPLPIHGGWCAPKPNGVRECACPQPAFGGSFCTGSGTGPVTAPVPAYCGDDICNGNETGEAGHPNPLVPGDTQQTCLNDCDFVDCGGCSTVESEGLCGGLCGTQICTGLQVCESSRCAATCPAYRATCVDNAGLCSGTCACNPDTWAPITTCGVGVGGCSPTALQRCFQNSDCDDTCTPAQMVQPRNDPSCGQCAAITETIPCGGPGNGPSTVTFDPTLNGQTATEPCPAGCTGGPMRRNCSGGVWGSVSNWCTAS